MKRLVAACLLLGGCATQVRQERFVKLDQEFRANARVDPPRVFVDEVEMARKQAPPYRFVGVVEVEGLQTEKLSVFYERVVKAGAGVGCEAMLQRDAFQGGVRVLSAVTQSLQRVGGDRASVREPGGGGSFITGGGDTLYRNDMAIWQFLCGVGGATDEQAKVTMKKAVALAVKMRADELGFEPCAAYTPLGSHVRKVRLCWDDPNGRSRPDGASSER
jgi:hypothetical protein